MEKRKSSVRYSPEVRERAVRMVLEHAGDPASQGEAIPAIAEKRGCSDETLRHRVRQAECERGVRTGLEAVVASGLQPGKKVILLPGDAIREGCT